MISAARKERAFNSLMSLPPDEQAVMVALLFAYGNGIPFRHIPSALLSDLACTQPRLINEAVSIMSLRPVRS